MGYFYVLDVISVVAARNAGLHYMQQAAGIQSDHMTTIIGDDTQHETMTDGDRRHVTDGYIAFYKTNN